MKYQVSFHAKTWYLHIWKYRCCYGFIINRAFHTKKLLKWNGLVVHWCLYFLVLKKYFTRSVRSLLKYFSTLAEKFRIYTRPCNISSISQLVCTLGFVNFRDANFPRLQPKVELQRNQRVYEIGHQHTRKGALCSCFSPCLISPHPPTPMTAQVR